MSGKQHQHHQQHEEEGEGWLVSYADLMTLMFGFFVLMYKAVSDDGRVKELQKKIGESLSGFERPVMEHIDTPASEERQARAFQLLLKMIELNPTTAVSDIEKKFADQKQAKALKDVFAKKMGEEGMNDVSFATDANLKIIIPTDAGFSSGSAKLTPAAEAKLVEISQTLIKMKDMVKLEVIAHTDDIPPRAGGEWASNWSLSAARAASVGDYFQAHGFGNQKLKISGAADTAPLISPSHLSGEALADARRQNRRIELVVSRRTPERKDTP
jgi:chemotaxis protein MotB